jgi:hypothetical protein
MREGNCVRVVDGVVKKPGVLDASRIKNKSSGNIRDPISERGGFF